MSDTPSDKPRGTPKGTSQSRRKFFRTLGLTGSALGAASVAGGWMSDAPDGAEPQTQSKPGTPQKKGYRLTQHIKTYYKKAAL